MKVSATNQSLILASDGPTGVKPPASASQSSRSTSNGGTSATALQRLTVVAELPDSTVVTVHADYAGRGGDADSYSNPSRQSDRVVSSQTPSASQGDKSDSAVEALLGSISSSGSPAATESATATDAVATTGTNTTASTRASASSLVQLSSPAYNSLLRDSNNSRDTAGNPRSSNENVALYARTQRTTGTARSSSLVDVHA